MRARASRPRPWSHWGSAWKRCGSRSRRSSARASRRCRGTSRSGPARFLPESSFRGRQHKKLQYAVLAAAALHGGTEPDLLAEVAWWQTYDFWEYALYAAAAYIRAAASH